MLRTDLTDHRGTDDARLMRAVADGDAIALAEAYHRTVAAAHACARRLLASPVEIEALLRSVYSELWEEPPIEGALEGWVRARCFAQGSGYLRQRGLSAPSASLANWTPGIDAADRSGGHDPLERMIAELDEDQQIALVRAHDRGLRTSEHDEPDAGPALLHALLALASPLTDDERHAADMCSSGVALANWVFGLLPPYEAANVPGTAAEPTPCGRLSSVLRRARRRFEPLPPTPDLGHRVLAWVLSTGDAGRSGRAPSSSLDTDLRVASAEASSGAASRGGEAPRSSLDMTVPSIQPVDEPAQRITALHGDGDAAGDSWSRPDGRRQIDDMPTARRTSAGPPALAGSASTPIAFGSAAPAFAPDPALLESDDDTGEDLVRMPLRHSRRGDRSGQGAVASAFESRAEQDDDQTQTIPPPLRERSEARSDAPRALRPADDGRRDPAPPPPALRAQPDLSDDQSPVPPPPALRSAPQDNSPVPPPPALRSAPQDNSPVPPPPALRSAPQDNSPVPPPPALRSARQDNSPVPPPPALRTARDHDPMENGSSSQGPNPLGLSARNPLGLDSDHTAASPFGHDRYDHADDSNTTEALHDEGEGGSLFGRDERTRTADERHDRSGDAAGLDGDATMQSISHDRGPFDPDATARTPLSSPASRRGGMERPFEDPSDAPPPWDSNSGTANLTAPALPPARRPTPPDDAGTRGSDDARGKSESGKRSKRGKRSGASDHRGEDGGDARGSRRPSGQGRAATGRQMDPAAARGPRVSADDADQRVGGNSVVRWLIVLLLIAAGAAVGVLLGQAVI